MQNIKLSHLRVFAKVAEHGSISRAATRLHRSPSAVSMMVANLEQRLEKPLFEAEGKSRLTPFGQYVFEAAQRQLAQFDRSVAKIESFAKNEFGAIEISSVPSFALSYLPDLLLEYRYKFPNISITVRDNSSLQIIRQVERGEIDIGIAGPPVNQDNITFKPLLTDIIGIVCSVSHPLAKTDQPPSLKDLQGHAFISNGTCDLINSKQFQRIRQTATIEVENTTSLLAMISAGVGVTTLPRLAVPFDRKDIVFVPTSHKDLSRILGLGIRRNKTLGPAALTFFELASSMFDTT